MQHRSSTLEKRPDLRLRSPALRVLYDYAWFVGFAVAFVLYRALMRGTPDLDLERVPL